MLWILKQAPKNEQKLHSIELCTCKYKGNTSCLRNTAGCLSIGDCRQLILHASPVFMLLFMYLLLETGHRKMELWSDLGWPLLMLLFPKWRLRNARPVLPCQAATVDTNICCQGNLWPTFCWLQNITIKNTAIIAFNLSVATRWSIKIERLNLNWRPMQEYAYGE